MEEHLYIVTYDIGDPKRWRVVLGTLRIARPDADQFATITADNGSGLMNGYGEWVQLSVFQCRLSRQRHAEMIATLDEVIDDAEDHVVIVDLGLAEKVEPRVVSLGKATFTPVKREALVI
jgi:CRISPR-associated protein Cas2